MPSNKQKKLSKASSIKRRQIDKQRKFAQHKRNSWAAGEDGHTADDEISNTGTRKPIGIDQMLARIPNKDAKGSKRDTQSEDGVQDADDDLNSTEDSDEDIDMDVATGKVSLRSEQVGNKRSRDSGNEDNTQEESADMEPVVDQPGTSSNTARTKRARTIGEFGTTVKKRKLGKDGNTAEKHHDKFDEFTALIITIQTLFPAKGA